MKEIDKSLFGSINTMNVLEAALDAKRRGVPCLVDATVIASFLDCSVHKLARDRHEGRGLAYKKLGGIPGSKGGRVRYDLRDLLDHVEKSGVDPGKAWSAA